MFSWFWRTLHTYVTGNFHCSEFAYIAYPFGRIYKLLGFTPIQLRRGEFLRNGCGSRMQWDTKAWMWTAVNVFVYTSEYTKVENMRKNMHESEVVKDVGIFSNFYRQQKHIGNV